MGALINYQKEGKVAVFTINRPEALNSINVSTLEELHDPAGPTAVLHPGPPPTQPIAEGAIGHFHLSGDLAAAGPGRIALVEQLKLLRGDDPR